MDPVIEATDDGRFNETLRVHASAPVWAYLRVSSQKQVDDGGGLDTQRQAVQAYADEKKLSPVIFVEEQASAGKPLMSVRLPGTRDTGATEISPRPIFMALLGHLITPSQVKRHLIVYRLDRFARISSEQDLLLGLLHRSGVEVHSTQASEQSVLLGTDMSDPGRIMIRQVMAAFSQYERGMIQMRMQAGLRAKASRGGWVSGRPPFGYRIENRDLVINLDESLIVQVIFYLRSQLGLSLSQIVDALKAEWAHTTYRSQVVRVLKSEGIYRGVYTDPYGVQHNRPEYTILPDDWHTWAETHAPKRTPSLEFTP